MARNLAAANCLIASFFLEAISFGGILLLILYMMRQSGSLNNALPIMLICFCWLSSYACLQQIYSSFNQLIVVSPAVDELYNDLKNLKLKKLVHNENVLSIDKSISLKNVHYNYPNSSRTALKMSVLI